jgi:hypothetical protein
MKAKSTSSATGGKMKMVIKPFKVAPKVADNLVATLWESMLEPAVDAVFSKQESVVTSNTQQQRISKEELYRAVEDICMQKQAAEVRCGLAVWKVAT